MQYIYLNIGTVDHSKYIQEEYNINNTLIKKAKQG
jgi:hypothetical protein